MRARWKREPKNRPTSADLPNSHALWVCESSVLAGVCGRRKSADSVVSSRVVPSLLSLSILLQQSSSATSSLGISNGDHVLPQWIPGHYAGRTVFDPAVLRALHHVHPRLYSHADRGQPRTTDFTNPLLVVGSKIDWLYVGRKNCTRRFDDDNVRDFILKIFSGL